jgi:hypothetical protein
MAGWHCGLQAPPYCMQIFDPVLVMRLLIPLLLIAVMPAGARAQQVPDTTFDVTVARPAFGARAPLVLIDEAHNNFHTSTGRYRPFANLLRNDGFRVATNDRPLSARALAEAHILVIANALPPESAARHESAEPAFTADEAEALWQWVNGGGALLLIADHAPFGGAAGILAQRFDVNFGDGFVYDTAHYLTSFGARNLPGVASIMVFSRENGLLGTHPILQGRDPRERIERVVAFTGQSMSVPSRASVLLHLSPTAKEARSREHLAGWGGTPVGGRAMGLAMSFGRGRVVILGEAAMMSAQVANGNPETRQPGMLMGMNHPGSDDKQFALNVMRWLARELPD